MRRYFGAAFLAAAMAFPASAQQVIPNGSWVLESPQYPDMGNFGVFSTSEDCQQEWAVLSKNVVAFVAEKKEIDDKANAANNKFMAEQQAESDKYLSANPPPVPTEAQQDEEDDREYKIGHAAYLADTAMDGAMILESAIQTSVCIQK